MENKTAEEFMKLHQFDTSHINVKLAITMMEEYASLQCAEMKEENERLGKMILEEPYQTIERLKAELLERDAIWLPAKDAEIESSQIEIKQLQEEVERLKSALTYARNMLVGYSVRHPDERQIMLSSSNEDVFLLIEQALSGKESKTE